MSNNTKNNLVDNLRAANNDDDRVRIINHNASDLNDKDLDSIAGGKTAVTKISALGVTAKNISKLKNTTSQVTG